MMLMMMLRAVGGLIALYAVLPASADGGKKVFCYYSSFAQNRQGIGKFLPEDIDPFLCTHLIFAFVDIHSDGTDLIAFNRNDVGPSGLYQRTMSLKKQNPALKVLLAVGGWQIGSKPFIPMISHPENMRRWIKNVVVYLRRFNFDGFDMDWEFPATRGSPPEDKYRYTKLMKGLYEAFVEEARETGREKLLLTMATASGTYFIDASYEPHKLIPYMDYMLLMTYNYHGQWEKRTGHHSPLRKHRNDPPGEQSELFQNWSIDYWLDMGVPKDKLVVGLATYGMSFTLADPTQHGVHSPVRGGGRMGHYTKETGILSYYEICQNIENKGWRTGWIDDQDAPYAYGGDQWVGYDNIDSMRMKVDNIMKRGLAGAFVWSVEMDDFGGVCGDGRYPLLSTVTGVLKPYEGLAIVAPAVNQPGKATPKSVEPTRTTTSGDLAKQVDEPRRTAPVVPAKRTTTPKKTMPGSPFPVPVAPTVSGKGSSQTTISKGKRVTWWGKPTWRPWNTKATKAPWWKRTTASVRHTPNWNARPTGRPSPSHDHHTTTSGPRNDWENSVNNDKQSGAEEKRKNWYDVSRSKSRSGRQHSKKRPKSAASAGSQAGGSVTCHGLQSGVHPHPDDCEKFIMCMPGAWMDLPPHVMSCPASTRFDNKLKVCNHAASVECWD